MNIAVIFAGGTGQRMRAERPKQFLEMYKKPIIIYTLEHFERHKDIDAIIISCLEEWIPYLNHLIEQYGITKVNRIVPGGETGQMSIYNGLIAAKDITDDEKNVVLIHDGVRPLIDEQIITDNINGVKTNGSAITSSKVTETIFVVTNDEHIDYVPERSQSRIAKAPQSFWLEEILDAHSRAQKDKIIDFIDSCTMMQHYGYDMYLVNGSHKNIKITTPEDFYIMKAILDAEENMKMYFDDGIKFDTGK